MLIIGNGRLVTRDEAQPFFENGAVAVDGERICKVGTLEEVRREFPEGEFVDARGGLIMPAFINAMNTFTAPWQEGCPSRDMTPRGFWISWTACGGPLTGI